MLDAAAQIVEELGLTAATVERVCARAGYTRGAFYSNFESMDDLLIALFERHAELVAARLTEGFGAVEADGGPVTADQVVERVLRTLPLSRQWFQVSTEMMAQALRRSEAATVLAQHRSRMRGFLAACLSSAIQRMGRTPTTSVADLTEAVLAMYEGTLAQAHLDGNDAGHDRQVRFIAITILAMTEPAHRPS
ncbi:TetR family transcriptional regulator [Phytohabitans rumicis]|uniref:TetR family transcriptional regulator n=2 Tax=Phytohabitans rumicis TaxID=1076125 RepID=A0A6V8LHT9_9ACTN|nr:TetR family transcriptional regulator [Phytohabitans rumicis]